jgi:succinate-semialdehyde dehydrogenase / glutarate-semialdehyde dehydrogenase
MVLISKNPATEEIIKEHSELTNEEIEQKLAVAHDTYLHWRETSFSHRAERLKRAAEILRTDARKYAEIVTREMGKPIKESLAGMEKCAWVCEYYAENAQKFLSPEYIETDARESYVRFDPIGVVLAIMPWNFPFWQVFRFIAPASMAGNVGVLKHASNVQMCAKAIEEIFDRAGFPQGVFQNLCVGSGKVEQIIRDDIVQAVTLTGSEYAGTQVASQAGGEVKHVVLELGGSDPFIILDDSDLDLACLAGAGSRLLNNGQSCIAAKRFIVVESRLQDFLEKLKLKFESMVIGDPLLESTQIGPLVNEQSLKEIGEQVKRTLESGAKLVTGGERHEGLGYFYKPTIIANVKKGMLAYNEEIFGPVATVISVRDTDEAIQVANDSKFGLGASLWTQNLDLAKQLVPKIEAGAVFVNDMVRSDPRLPFGGVKKSGVGRELSHYGIKEFVNVKTVWIK